MILHFWAFFQSNLSKFSKVIVNDDLKSVGERGVGGQISDFGYLCAQFYCPLCDGSKNLQF